MKHKLLIIIFLLFIATLGVTLFFFQTDIQDYLTNLSYTPPAEISALTDNIPFTDKGKSIFKASRPALEDADSFNEHCKSHNAEISVLGCYTDKTIYLYNIDNSELSGIVESTAAHEMLHAAWDRLPEWEKSALESELYNVYTANKEALSGDLEIYTEDKKLDELHSRIGTQIAQLPQALEEHYAKYFTDQDAVVQFYNNYIEPFRALSSEIEALGEELEAENAEIDRRTQNYYATADHLEVEINAFNHCAETGTCPATDSQRRALIAAQDDLEAEYEELNAAIESYNAKVESYNQNVLRTKNLENAINSNRKEQNETIE